MARIRSLLNLTTYACVVVTCASAMRYLGGLYVVLFSPVLILSIYLDHTRRAAISRWLLNLASIASILISLARITADSFVEPIMEALVCLIAIKILADKQVRDYMQIYALCLFLLIGSTLISLSPVFIVYFSLFLFLTTTSLILLAHHSRDPEMNISRKAMARVVYTSLLVCGLSAPMAAVLFIILPRTPYPLLHILERAGVSRTGFSDDMKLGEISEIQEDRNVIFRVEMDKIEDDRLYWRGIILDEFDGRSWRSSKKPTFGGYPSPIPHDAVRQTIYLEPYGNRYLFALDRPVLLSLGEARHASGLTYSTDAPIFGRKKYMALSASSLFVAETTIGEDDYEDYLKLPDGLSPRIRELGAKLSAGMDERGRIDAFLRFLKHGQFRYSLKELPVSEDPLGDFLFSLKHGNCEYFASALAVMLRSSGIPARLVGGYKGGYYNETGRYYMVLESNAHVWVEAYIAEKGWLRLDPTPMRDSGAEIIGPLALKIALLTDTFAYYWNKAIIEYDLNHQIALWNTISRNLAMSSSWFDIDRRKTLVYCGSIPLFAALIHGAMLLRNRRKRRTNALVSRFQSRLARCGHTRNKNEGLEEYAARIPDETLRRKAMEFVLDFEAIYYRDTRFTKEDAARLGKLITEIKQQREAR